jgi:hypothetical protein
MNKKESGQRQFVTEPRQRSFGRFTCLQFIAFCVGKGLTLIGISVNGSGAHPLDGLLLGGGSKAQNRDLT